MHFFLCYFCVGLKNKLLFSNTLILFLKAQIYGIIPQRMICCAFVNLKPLFAKGRYLHLNEKIMRKQYGHLSGFVQ